MPNGIRLLQQVRRATAELKHDGLTPAQETLLSLIDLVLKELVLQGDPDFYRRHIEQGRQLLLEGLELAASIGGSVKEVAMPRDDLGPETRYEVLSHEIKGLHRGLAAVVNLLDEMRSLREKDYLTRLSRWESELYRHRLVTESDTSPVESNTITQSSLAEYLGKRFAEREDLKVTKFVPLHGGLSKLTVLFETEDIDGLRQELVLRAAKPTKLLHFDGSDVSYEYHTLKLMYESGLPVPEPLWLEKDASLLGMPFLVSRMAQGKIINSSLSSVGEVDPEIPASALQMLARLHQVRLDAANSSIARSQLAEWLPYPTIRAAALHYATGVLPELLRRAQIEPTPQIVRVMHWLAASVPDCDEAPVVVHYDFGYHNLLYVGNKVSAVLDWEMARMGDPADDIVCTQQIIGAYPMTDFLERYRRLTGRHVSAYRIAYAKVAYTALVHIAGLTTLRDLDEDANASIQIAGVAFRLMPMFGASFDELIADADRLRASANGSE